MVVTVVDMVNEEEKERVFEDSFMKEVTSFVSSMLRGITIVKIMEGDIGNNDYQIAICVKYNPEFTSFKNITELKANKALLNGGRINYLKSIMYWQKINHPYLKNQRLSNRNPSYTRRKPGVTSNLREDLRT